MVRFREAREAAGMKQPEAVRKLGGLGSQVDVPLLSKIENGRCLPIPHDAQAMCSVYGVGMLDLADVEDITFALVRPKKEGYATKEKRYYKLTVRLDLELASALIEALRVLGLEGMTAWVTRYARRTVKRAQKKSAACVRAQTTQEVKSIPPVV